MKPELNHDYIKLLMKEIISATTYPNIRRKAQMVLDHISQAEKDHIRAMEELEADMDIFRQHDEANDIRGELNV